VPQGEVAPLQLGGAFQSGGPRRVTCCGATVATVSVPAAEVAVAEAVGALVRAGGAETVSATVADTAPWAGARESGEGAHPQAAHPPSTAAQQAQTGARKWRKVVMPIALGSTLSVAMEGSGRRCRLLRREHFRWSDSAERDGRTPNSAAA
jgi:hypothetical protein